MSERACSFTILLASVIASVLASACSADATHDGTDQPAMELRFDARMGQAAFACGGVLPHVGTSALVAEPLDLRLYVHDVKLLRENGEQVAFELAPDEQWQSTRVALLDFEDGSGRGDRGTEAVNTALRGSAPDHTDYVGLSFTLGVPADLDHLDLATAVAPLDVPGMWWSWQGGYKYLRAELSTPANPDGFLFHLGAANCVGSPANGYVCEQRNLPRVTLLGDVHGRITLDLAALFAGVDLGQKPDLVSDLVPGCMSHDADPECPPLFATLGLPDGQQEVFSLP